MLIDDDEVDNFINRRILEVNNFAEKIYVNTSGNSAIEFLQNLYVIPELADKLMPKVIFVDINMPLMDGFQFIERFELLLDMAAKKSKIVILSSSANPDDKKRSKQFKNDILFLTKPLSPEGLKLI